MTVYVRGGGRRIPRATARGRGQGHGGVPHRIAVGVGDEHVVRRRQRAAHLTGQVVPREFRERRRRARHARGGGREGTAGQPRRRRRERVGGRRLVTGPRADGGAGRRRRCL